MDSRRDDTHVRWENQDELAHLIWKQYDEVIFPQIIKYALAQKSCSLKKIYHAISIKRLECEFKKTPHEDKFSVGRKTYFGALGYSKVPNVRSTQEWGKLATDLVCERAPKSSMSCGLSYYSCVFQGMIDHPNAFTLAQSDVFFQQLLSTTDFFNSLHLTARLMYDLSNFPPIIRGSAAVNTQIFDNIAINKFALTFKITPKLYDWIAFFETQEQYIGYYVISVVAEYLKRIPTVYEKHKSFFDELFSILTKNPNNILNLYAREMIWEKLKTYIADLFNTPSLLNIEQKHHLESIMRGRLIFRKPSDEMLKLVDAINEHDKTARYNLVTTCKLSTETLHEIIERSGYSLQKLEKMFNLHENVVKIYLKSYGNPEAEEALNADWCDLEILRTLERDRNNLYFATLNKKIFPTFKEEKVIVPQSESGYGIIHLSQDPNTIEPKKLLEQVNHKLTYALYMKSVFFIDNDGKPLPVTFKDPSPFFPKKDDALYKEILDTFPETQDQLDDLMNRAANMMYFDQSSLRFSPRIDFLRRVSLATWEDIPNIPLHIVKLLSTNDATPEGKLAQQLINAIWSGGVSLQDLSTLTMGQLQIISSPYAMGLYEQNKFIHAEDILQSGVFASMEGNSFLSNMSSSKSTAAKPELEVDRPNKHLKRL